MAAGGGRVGSSACMAPEDEPCTRGRQKGLGSSPRCRPATCRLAVQPPHPRADGRLPSGARPAACRLAVHLSHRYGLGRDADAASSAAGQPNF